MAAAGPGARSIWAQRTAIARLSRRRFGRAALLRRREYVQDLDLIAKIGPSATVVLPLDGVDHVLRLEPGEISNPRKYRKQLRAPIDARVLNELLDWMRHLPAVTQA